MTTLGVFIVCLLATLKYAQADSAAENFLVLPWLSKLIQMGWAGVEWSERGGLRWSGVG